MGFALPSTLFSSKKSFTQLLPSLLNQQISVEQISQHLTTNLELFNEFSLIFLQNLVDQTLNIKPIIVLTCFNTYFVEYLADNEKDLKDVDEARTIMFSYCLKIRNTRQDLDDIEIYRVLYSILDLCAPSISLSWQKELDLLSLEKQKKILQKYDDLIENYIRNPSKYPTEITESNNEQDLDVITRFLLFNILFESKMKPLQFKNDKRFTFSDAWINMLRYTLHSPLHTKFNVVVQLTEKTLWNFQAEHLNIESSQNAAFDTDLCTFSNQQEFDNTLRECLQSLKVTHSMYISTIVCNLIQLIQYARISYNHDSQLQDQINRMSQAIWFEIYQSLLSDAVFETTPFEGSPTIVKLFKVAACYIQFRLTLKTPHTDFPMSIWDHYYLQRSIFLKSTGITNDIPMIEKMVFTSTSALY